MKVRVDAPYGGKSADAKPGKGGAVGKARFAWLLCAGLLSALVGFAGKSYWDVARAHPERSLQQILAGYFVPSPQQVFGSERLSVLLLGIDYNYDARDIQFSKGARSDTIMAASLDFTAPSIHELSIPRDMDVVLPSGNEDKINAAFAEGGIAEAQRVVAGFLGIPKFDRYVVLRVDATKDVIDALGGVDVDVMNADALRHQGKNGPLNYDDNWGHLHIHLKPGMQHLNGTQAVGYARFRHDWCSDPCRILRQQQVTRAVIARIQQNKLNTLAHVQDLLAVARKDIDTNFTPQEELSLATAFSGINLASVKTEQVPYRGDKDLPLAGNVLVPDQAAKARLVAATFGPAQAPIHVTIENGTGEAGLAGKVAAALRSRGFAVDAVQDAASFGYRTTEIHAPADRPNDAERVRNGLGLPNAALKIDAAALTARASDVTVIVGRDYLSRPPVSS
jgi:LCP family protein required for cell wall assembly